MKSSVIVRASQPANYRSLSRCIGSFVLLACGSSLMGQMAGWPPMPERAFQKLLSGDTAGFVRMLQDQAQSGDVPSMFYLGRAYEEVKGVPHDFLQAQKWYRAAAEHGSGPAAWSLGCLYEGGKGVSADPAQAQRWFQRASELGYRRTALVVSYVRWHPGPEPLTQSAPGSSHTPIQLGPEEMALLKNAGTGGRLEVQGSSLGRCGLPAHLIVVAQNRFASEVDLALPMSGTVIYRQDGDTWTKIPAHAPTSDKKLRLTPQDVSHPNDIVGTVEQEDGSESGGSAFVWH